MVDFFHKWEHLKEDKVNDYLNSHRFIYINVTTLPGLLNEGEWDWYIKEAGN